MSNRTASILACAALAGALAACTKPIPPTVGCDFTPMLNAQQSAELALLPATPGTMVPIPLNAISMTDAAITNKVMVQSATARRTETGTVEVSTRLVNCTDYPLQVEGRTHFLDKGQSPTEPVSAWRRVFLPARSIGMYSESSTASDAVATYLIELREGH